MRRRARTAPRSCRAPGRRKRVSRGTTERLLVAAFRAGGWFPAVGAWREWLRSPGTGSRCSAVGPDRAACGAGGAEAIRGRRGIRSESTSKGSKCHSLSSSSRQVSAYAGLQACDLVALCSGRRDKQNNNNNKKELTAVECAEDSCIIPRIS